ncbi:Hypothetical protein FKW44_002440 [Caligus rogercresseyi]|uniref:Uncharacterized protein n=1 Tax=Caligus rogercresseyi TaxID=217165 RepID=A0A7T8KKE1_CALRO|nr:Hypothetical protein FKW44_002440 [Caligus rogercresseyi]
MKLNMSLPLAHPGVLLLLSEEMSHLEVKFLYPRPSDGLGDGVDTTSLAAANLAMGLSGFS